METLCTTYKTLAANQMARTAANFQQDGMLCTQQQPDRRPPACALWRHFQPDQEDFRSYCNMSTRREGSMLSSRCSATVQIIIGDLKSLTCKV